MAEITGRDSYIIEKALFYAAHFIEGMPVEYQAWNDRSDMLKILRAMLGDRFMDWVDMHGRNLEMATGRPFNMEEY